MGALACPVGETDQLLLAFGRRANDDKNALLLILEPRLQVDAVRPHIDIAPGREIALLPAVRVPRSTPPSTARRLMPTGRAHPCRAARPAPLRSHRSRCPSDKGSGSASPNSLSAVRRAEGSQA